MFAEFYRKFSLLIWLGLALLVANIAVFFLLTQPKINAEAIGRERLSEAMQRQTELRTRLNSLAEDRNALDSAREDLAEFYEKTLGNRKRQTDLIRERNEIAQDYGVVPTRVNYSNTIDRDQPIERFSMSFSLQGNYASLRYFLNSIERSPSFFIIDSVELEGGDEDRELAMRIAFSTYFYRPEGAVAEAGGER